MSLLLTFALPAGKIRLIPGYFSDKTFRRVSQKGITDDGVIPSRGEGAQPVFINSAISCGVGRSWVRVPDFSFMSAGYLEDVFIGEQKKIFSGVTLRKFVWVIDPPVARLNPARNSKDFVNLDCLLADSGFAKTQQVSNLRVCFVLGDEIENLFLPWS